MRIGIYDQYFTTYGGGERYVLVLAEYLVKLGLDVSLISTTPFSIDEIDRRMGIDVSGATMVIWPGLPEDQLGPLTADYDVFINATFFSRLKSFAARSYKIEHFPYRSLHRYPVRVKALARRLGDLVFRDRYVTPYGAGFYDLEQAGTEWGRWSTFDCVVELPHLTRRAKVRFRDYVVPRQELTISALASDGQPLAASLTDDEVTVHSPTGEQFSAIRLRVHRPDHGDAPESGARALGIFVVDIDTGRGHGVSQSILDHFLGIRDRSLRTWLGLVDYFSRQEAALSYDRLVANSRYGYRWTKEVYPEHPDVAYLYAPIDVDRFTRGGSKGDVIICVGRFMAHGHCKKQREMIRTFRRLVKHPETAHYKLVVVGAVNEQNPSDIEYYKQCVRDGYGLNIDFRPNADIGTLEDCYAEASIFWHAAGFDVDEAQHPDRLEHFGITTVEASSAGAIPVVINKGGQVEIIDHGRSGFVWNSLDELESITRMIARGECDVEGLRRAAVANAERFSTDTHIEAALKIFGLEDLVTSLLDPVNL